MNDYKMKLKIERNKKYQSIAVFKSILDNNRWLAIITHHLNICIPQFVFTARWKIEFLINLAIDSSCNEIAFI